MIWLVNAIITEHDQWWGVYFLCDSVDKGQPDWIQTLWNKAIYIYFLCISINITIINLTWWTSGPQLLISSCLCGTITTPTAVARWRRVIVASAHAFTTIASVSYLGKQGRHYNTWMVHVSLGKQGPHFNTWMMHVSWGSKDAIISPGWCTCPWGSKDAIISPGWCTCPGEARTPLYHLVGARVLGKAGRERHVVSPGWWSCLSESVDATISPGWYTSRWSGGT